jgi:glycosyltransferase involved in cell wall biosynthesis
MIRVIHVGPKSYPPAHGGVETMVYQLVEALGAQATAAIYVEWSGSGGNVHVLGKGLFSQWFQVMSAAKRYAPCIVHLHKETFLPLGLLLRVCGCRCMVTLHGCAWRLSRWSPLHRVAGFLLDWIGCWMIQRTVFVGKRDWSLFQRLTPLRELAYIPNGVLLDDAPVGDKSKGCVYIGRISPEKNILNLIDAAETAGIDLDLYGPFDRRDEGFKAKVMEKLERATHVQWRGSLSHDQVYQTLRRYRTLINVSYSEGMPVSVLEAAACGLNLVLSDIPQHRVLGMPVAAYVATDDLLLHSAAQLPEGGANRRHVGDFFEVTRMADRYRAIYREMLK